VEYTFIQEHSPRLNCWDVTIWLHLHLQFVSSHTAYETAICRNQRYRILHFVGRASCYKFLPITNLTRIFMYSFISSLYMLLASQCSSSGDRIVSIHHLVGLVCVSDWLVCRSGVPSWPAWYAGHEFPPDRHTKQSLTETNHTRWYINTIRSPDDEHCDAWNM
jgi:hypothetical protein